MKRILLADHRGKLELERFVDDEDGESDIMLSFVPAHPLLLTLESHECRQLAAWLMDFADEQDAAEAGQ